MQRNTTSHTLQQWTVIKNELKLDLNVYEEIVLVIPNAPKWANIVKVSAETLYEKTI
jgi:hypothetical protein